MGQQNGMVAKIQHLQPKICAVHCAAHRLALAARDTLKMKGLEVFCSVENYLIKTYSFFSHSAKRMESLRSQQEKYETKGVSLKRCCPTRWLSLNSAVNAFTSELPAIIQSLMLFQ
jgi:hypothetical protein